MTTLLDRFRHRPTPKPKPADPQPPDPEALEAANALLAAVARCEGARLALVAPRGDVDAAEGRLAAACRWAEEVERREGDFTYKRPTDFGDDKAPGRRVRREVVEANAREEVAASERALAVARAELDQAQAARDAALAEVVRRLDDAASAEQLLNFDAATAGRGLEAATMAHAMANSAVHAACTRADEARLAGPRTLESIIASGRPPATSEVAAARATLDEARGSMREAAAKVATLEERTRTYHRVVATAIAAERAAFEREGRPKR